LRETSRLADSAISAALRIVGGEQTLAVFALGRLGTSEFDIASDADLLFVRAPDTEEADARGVAEKLVHVLTVYTKEGTIFAVDTRLRPHGAEGELVVTPSQIERYLVSEAQPWEALTFSKLRFVAGRKDLAESLPPVVWRGCVEIATRPAFAQAVVEMRGRLEKSNRFPNSFKLARGGFYDIDFIASFLMLSLAKLYDGTTLDRLDHLRREGKLSPPRFEKLRPAALLYRTTDHIIRLVTGRARPELPAAEYAHHATESLVSRILDRDHNGRLQEALRAAAEEVREVFREILSH
jgi:glutamate-ammonia-ligase adenylyltransferase